MPTTMRLTLRCGLAALLAFTVLAAAGRAHAARDTHATTASAVSLKTFAGTWIGHTRGLTISKTGAAYEELSSGCCDQELRMHFQLSDPQGTPANATALARVTSIELLKASDWAAVPKYHIPAHPKPYVGKTARIRLRNGVITEPLDGFNTTYCDSKAEAKGVCGA